MKIKDLLKLKRKIIIRKKLLNFLLVWFNPRNTLMIVLSKNLDTHIAKYQKILSLQHKHEKYKLDMVRLAIA
ncbi:hypothetical protein FDC58_09175 [Clostridium botulinum]|uniref:hypothetical protein n=1 Tax=Clostridium TaxID=1485 RepID=UPI000502085B|nr:MULTISPECIES: hypothetical protein [unclassified Clostridium]AIY81501.1 hypothetical protein U728_1762 [Clostridium botulinum 202F]KAI3347896.1 hypothetical protein CIT17_06475 [Clostridium botulinum]KFX53899.1 hypothetical protein KU40_18295 [Clostridium botulinum]KFX57111.1 hypothetical protein KU41_11845 [Clostridium botulinum]KON14646.1 hypothetical protein ACP50_03740 [Clostridium botulinum]